MRLAFVSIMGGAAWAASEELWSLAAKQALDDGHEVFVSVYARSANAPQVAELRAAGATIELRTINRWVNKSALISRLAGSFSEFSRFKADAVCVSQGGTYDIARSGNMRVLRKELKRNRIPYVLLCHCQQEAPRAGRRRRTAEALSNASVLGVLSKNLAQLSERHLGVPLPKARVFQNPLKLRTFECLPWPEDADLKMAFVGRLEHVKGLDLLIDALTERTWKDRAWRLTICGSGPDRQALEDRVRIAGLADRIEFAGFVADVVEVWKRHHVLVMSSRFEGIPIALNEAMLCGRAAVATDVGGIREALQDGETGFLIRNPEVPHVIAALERLWTHRSELQSMGRKAFESALAARDANPGATLVEWLKISAANRNSD